MNIRTVLSTQDLLGEGPLWDAACGALWWVDIRRALLHRYSPATQERRDLQLAVRTTALGLAKDGRMVASCDQGFVWIDPDTGVFEVIATPEGEPSGNRFNDGKVDAQGRFWAGTMDDAEEAALGALHCLEPSGVASRVATGFMVPNGPAFDFSGNMYLTDSARRVIFRHPAHAPGGADKREIFIQFDADHGYPDGMTFDAEDHLWVAFWDGWCLRRISPQGHIVEEIRMPVQRPTSCAFGGDALSTLFITSARTGLDEAALASQPDAGGLFAIDLPYKGRAAEIFG